jgi:hypothetical protein
VIWIHTNSYGSELPPSLVSQVVTGVNCHLAELTSQLVSSQLTEKRVVRIRSRNQG